MMKNYFAAIALSVSVGASAFTVDKIDPPYWWTGMHDTSLQLQIHGSDIRPADFSVDYPGVTVDSVVRLDGSPNWQYLYLNIAPDTRPGTLELTWREGRKKLSRKFELKQRVPMRGAQGFGAADVLYMIMPDRFADGNPANNSLPSMRFPGNVDRSRLSLRHGGDLKGISDHLDYIDSLGVTAVWLNPVLANDMPNGSYHGYATTDYYNIDPRFGTNTEYARLVSDMHDRGIKTVMDMIFNHCGSEHPWVLDPPASDWFNFQGDVYRETNHKLTTVSDIYASDYDRDLCLKGWFVKEMPDLNQLNPHVMKYLIQNSIFWIEDAQIDGIRMDTYVYADRKQMARWVKEVMDAYPEFNIVGECWFAEPANEQFWQSGSPVALRMGMDTALPTCMDFSLFTKSAGMKPFVEETGPWGGGLNTIYAHLALDYIYADPDNVLRFLDNHDTDRFLPAMPDSLDAWKQAQILLLTIPGIPQVYYGTELLMNGKKSDEWGGDGAVRRDVPGGFPGDTANWFISYGRSPLQNEAYAFMSKLLEWRRQSKAVAGGSMKHFSPDNGIYLYERKRDGEQVIVVLNGIDRPNQVDMSRYAEVLVPGAEYRDVITGQTVVLLPVSGQVTFPARHSGIYQRQ